jgi:hypothetical protein
MRRLWLLGLIALSAGLLLPSAIAAREPMLWSASQRHGHVVVTFTAGDLAPGELVAATSARRNHAGELVVGIKLSERLTLRTTDRRLRWRSPHTLRPGVYFVQVSGLEVDGLTDCTPELLGCGQRWSNIRRIVVPPS